MKNILSDLFLMGISAALLYVFIFMGITGRYVAIESIAWVYWLEMSMFTFFIGWSIYSIASKVRRK